MRLQCLVLQYTGETQTFKQQTALSGMNIYCFSQEYLQVRYKVLNQIYNNLFIVNLQYNPVDTTI